MNLNYLKKQVLLSLLFTLFSCVLNSQIYTINQGGTVLTCNGIFLDAGGLGNYSNNENYTFTICSASGGPISLDFTGLPFQVETNFDFLNK